MSLELREKYGPDYPYISTTLERQKHKGTVIKETLRTFLRIDLPLRLVPGDRLLDLGCGIGTIGSHLQPLGIKVYGVDINLHAINAGRKIINGPNSRRSLVATLSDLPFPSGFVKAVVSQDVLEHMQDETELIASLKEMERVSAERRMFHKITVLEDPNIDLDETHNIKWPTEVWSEFFQRHGWNVIAPIERSLKIPGVRTFHSIGNYLLEKSA